ncbi:MAG TPA: CPBP family intramembrane glutamic endopeptidase [Acidobacteriaceae bacterium]|nr:CPBP family intramembrane glutamic endopeptidase [Acidobacteriaceae bacterium]
MEALPPDPSANIPEPAPPLLSPAPRPRSTVLYGPNGLRAGWSIVIYVAVLISLLFLVGLELRWITPHLPASLRPVPGSGFHPTIAILSEASALIAVLLATAGMARLENRRAADYGLAGFDRVRQFLIGLVCGFAFLSLLVGILLATHHLTLTQSHMTLGWSLRYAAAWGLAFFLVGMTEEFMLRGYLLYTLARGIRFWPAAIVLAILFGALHKGNPGESPFGLVAAALIGLVFSLSLWRLGHLWWAIGFHVSWDWAESYFYGTPDSGGVSVGRLMEAQAHGAKLLSGGATGPEGSVWCGFVILLVAILVWTTQPNRGIQLLKK